MRALRRSTSGPLAAGMWTLLAGLVLWFVPSSLTDRARMVVCDALAPGLRLTKLASDQVSALSPWCQSRAVRELENELAESHAQQARTEERLHRLLAQAASRTEEHAVSEPAPHRMAGMAPLFVPALIEARVLGQQLSEQWREGRLINQGQRNGVIESALVLRSDKPLIDLGQSAQLSPEDPLLAGRCVVGKIETVGKWTSTYITVTDRDFRAPAQLLRDASTGPVWGEKGVLRGDGGSCRLEGVPFDAAVRVGDEVYAADRDGTMKEALYFGTVREARLGVDDREWHIVVEPATLPSTVTHVQILRSELNADRLWSFHLNDPPQGAPSPEVILHTADASPQL